MSELDQETGPDSVSRDPDPDIVGRILEGVLEHRRLGARILFAYVSEEREKEISCDDRMLSFPTLRMGRAKLPGDHERIGDAQIVIIIGTPFYERNEFKVSRKRIDIQGPE